jgi:hypothetical protein
MGVGACLFKEEGKNCLRHFIFLQKGTFLLYSIHVLLSKENKMKRIISSLFVILLVFSILSCSRKSAVNENVRSSMPISGGVAADKDLSQQTKTDSNYGGVPPGETSGSGISIPDQKIRKIIQNATVRISVESPEKAMDDIAKEVDKQKGYISGSNKTVYLNGINATMQIKIPAVALKPFLVFLGKLGKEESENINTNEITKEYYDTKARLENAINSKKQYEVTLSLAKKIPEILEVQKQIDSVQERIEQFKGQIALWDQLVDLSTVDIDIRQTEKAQAIEKKPNWNPLSWKDLGLVIKNTWISFANVIVKILQGLIIALPIILSLLVIVLFILWLVRKVVRLSKKSSPKK